MIHPPFSCLRLLSAGGGPEAEGGTAAASAQGHHIRGYCEGLSLPESGGWEAEMAGGLFSMPNSGYRNPNFHDD